MLHVWPARLLSFLLLFYCAAAAAQQIPFNSSGEWIQNGSKEYDQGHYQKALEWYRKVPEGDTNYLLSLYAQALTLNADSNFSESRALCLKAIQEGYADRRELLFNIAYATDKLGQPEEALRLYDSCAVLYPNDYRPYFEKAVVKVRQKDIPAATRLLQQALMRNPYHFRSHYVLGSIYVLEGRLTEAMMALQAALWCTNEKELAEGPIDMLNAVASQTEEMEELYRNKKAEYAHPLYDEIDAIVNAKAALNKAYTLKTSIDDKIIRQIQVALEKLRYDSKDTTFTMQYYVPLLQSVYEKDLFEAYILMLFSDYGIEPIDKLAAARKHQSKLEEVRGLIYSYLAAIRATRVFNYDQRQAAPELYHAYPDEDLLVEVQYADKAREKFAAGLARYYKDEALVLEGRHDAAGEQDGTWNYYYRNGRPQMREQYKNGKQTGEAISWYDNGVVESTRQYDADGVISEQRDYEYNGSIQSLAILKGKEEYEITYYHPDGSVLRVVRSVNGKMKDGAYSFLHPNGKIKRESTYKNGQQEGPGKVYYDNGQLKESCTYKADRPDGPYLSYYINGLPSGKYTYTEGKLNGPYEEYYETGGLTVKGNYVNGKEEGVFDYYDRKGNIYGTVAYSKGRVTALKYISPDGKILAEQKDPKGVSPMEYFDPLGFRVRSVPINSEGSVQGKVSYYYSSGILKEETEYKQDERDGPSVVYGKNGKLRSKCQYKGGQRDGYYQYYFDNGMLQTEGWVKEGLGQGIWRRYAENGKMIQEYFLIGDKLNGPEKNYELNGKLDYVRQYDYGMLTGLKQYDSTGKLMQDLSFDKGNGQYQMLYVNGNPALQCALKNGSLHGPYTIHAPDKKLLEKGTYAAGKKNGESITYLSNGKMRFKGSYKDGQRDGLWQSYNPDGTIGNETEFREGEFHGMNRFYAGGLLRSVTRYDNGEKDSAETIYGEENKIAAVLYYDMGVLTGYTYEDKDGKLLPAIPVTKGSAQVRTFYANGARALEYNIVHNYYDGIQKLFFSNGQLADEREFAADDRTGVRRMFNPDGSKLAETQYRKDVQQGLDNQYDNRGRLVSTMNFVDGMPNGPAKIINAEGNGMLDLWFYYGTLQ